VVDDGSIEGERGFIAYDDDGVKSGKTYLIKNGKLSGRLHSRFTAAIMDERPTGNSRAIRFNYMPLVRMTNTYIENGESTLDELLDGIDRGLYVVGALGGNTELEMFTFSSAKAYKIENGKITDPVRDVILSGNLFETLRNIDGVANDLKMFGGLGGCGKGGQMPLPVSDGAPHIRIRNVVIGGK
jgi:TldD protein